MKYYNLVVGDYIQSGDEYQDSNDKWILACETYFGCKYGFEVDDHSMPRTWRPMRRLVPDEFQIVRQKQVVNVHISEQWGEDFEI